MPYGLYTPFIKNTMPSHAFDFARRYIHFANNNKQNKNGETGYDPLFKVQNIMDIVMEMMRIG